MPAPRVSGDSGATKSMLPSASITCADVPLEIGYVNTYP